MKTEAQGQERRRRVNRVFSAREKARAVLGLWSGRRTTTQLTKELGVAWGSLNHWEKAGLEGMLSALDPAWKQPEVQQLPRRVARLLGQTLGSAQAPAVTPQA